MQTSKQKETNTRKDWSDQSQDARTGGHRRNGQKNKGTKNKEQRNVGTMNKGTKCKGLRDAKAKRRNETQKQTNKQTTK